MQLTEEHYGELITYNRNAFFRNKAQYVFRLRAFYYPTQTSQVDVYVDTSCIGIVRECNNAKWGEWQVLPFVPIVFTDSPQCFVLTADQDKITEYNMHALLA